MEIVLTLYHHFIQLNLCSNYFNFQAKLRFLFVLSNLIMVLYFSFVTLCYCVYYLVNYQKMLENKVVWFCTVVRSV